MLGLKETPVAHARKRRCPERYETGERSSYHYDESSEDNARREYFAALDNTISAIEERFHQESIGVYSDLVLLLKSAVSGDSSTIPAKLQELYSDDFNFVQLENQLSLLPQLVKSMGTVVEFASWLRVSTSRVYLDEVEKLTKLILTLPATNATSERGFSALKRIKTAMRSSMGQLRLNSCLLLHIYKERTDEIDVELVIKEFVKGHTDRQQRIAVL